MRDFNRFVAEHVAYQEKYKTSLIRIDFVSESGYKLGSVACRIRRGEYKLSEEEITTLNKINFMWRTRKVYTFENVYRLLCEYKEENGDCNVPQKLVVEGIPLGSIINNIRSGEKKITSEQRKMLSDLDFTWILRKKVPFEEVYRLLCEFVSENGHCKVPYNCQVGTVNLGGIVSSIRSGARKVTERQKNMLNEIGFVWRAKRKLGFEQIYKLLCEYKEEHNHLNIPYECRVNDIHLGKIVHDIKCGKYYVNVKQKKMLAELGMDMPIKINQRQYYSFEEIYPLLHEYKKEYGNCMVQQHFVINGIPLGMIVLSIRVGNRSVTSEERRKLDELGFVWDKQMRVSFNQVVEMLKMYKAEYGDCKVPYNFVTEFEGKTINLGEIIANIRYGNRKTTEEQRKILTDMGFVWRLRKA